MAGAGGAGSAGPGAGEALPVLEAGPHTYESVSDAISGIVLAGRPPLAWSIGVALGAAGTLVLAAAVTYLLAVGVGIWGVNVPVAWGFAITNFVWWIGIGHAGTLISAILLLLRQDWRTSINRFAEAMTLFAVACAGLFPLLHLGRPWFFYWLVPYPNTMALWPQFRSALVWDVFAVTTYLTVSFCFWYTGLIPDLATLRDRAKGKAARLAYGILALGWRGSARHWHRHEMAYLLLAGLSTPLVVSVHTVVSFDFAISVVPGWHSTIFPPYFVAGAIFSGFAMVITLAILLRWSYPVKPFITLLHLENSAKVLLATGLIVAYSYMAEYFHAWYSGSEAELFAQLNRALGPYAPFFWGLVACNVLAPQALWWGRVRRSIPALFAISIAVNIGMWLERFVIIVTGLHRDYMPSAWGTYIPTVWDVATFLGTLGFFLLLFVLFIRLLPMISIAEMRGLLPQSRDVRHDESAAT